MSSKLGDALITSRFSSLWTGSPPNKSFIIRTGAEVSNTINGVRPPRELLNFLLKLEEDDENKTYLDVDTFSFIKKMKSRSFSIKREGDFNDFIDDLRLASRRMGDKNEQKNIKNLLQKFQSKVHNTFRSNSTDESSDEISEISTKVYSSTSHKSRSPSPKLHKRVGNKGRMLSPKYKGTSRSSSPSPSPCPSSRQGASKKRPAEEDASTGLHLISRIKRRKEVSSDFIPSSELQAIAFPAHENAHFIIGFKPDDCGKKSSKTPKAGVARGYSKGIFGEGDKDDTYKTVIFRYDSVQKRNLIEEMFLRAQGTGKIELINPDEDSSEEDLKKWSEKWVCEVKHWMSEFMDCETSLMEKVATEWASFVKESKTDAKEEENEAGRRKENLVKAAERMNNSMT